jgi:hypothetical protein
MILFPISYADWWYLRAKGTTLFVFVFQNIILENVLARV